MITSGLLMRSRHRRSFSSIRRQTRIKGREKTVVAVLLPGAADGIDFVSQGFGTISPGRMIFSSSILQPSKSLL